MSAYTPTPDQAQTLNLAHMYLSTGNPVMAAAVTQRVLAAPSGATADAHLLLAEAFWRIGEGGEESARALPHYEAATELVVAAGDVREEAKIALGHGFALAQLGKFGLAEERMQRVLNLVDEEDCDSESAQFVRHLISQMQGARASSFTWEERVREMFPEAYVESAGRESESEVSTCGGSDFGSCRSDDD